MKTSRQHLEQLGKFAGFFSAIQGLIADVESIEVLNKQAKEAEVLRDRYKGEYEDWALKSKAAQLDIEAAKLGITEAKQKASAIIADAKTKANEIERAAKETANGILEKAETDAAVIKAPAEKERNEILAANQAKLAENRDLDASIGSKKAELADLEKRIEDATNKIKKVLGGLNG